MSNKYILINKNNKYTDHINKIINQSDYEINVIDEKDILLLNDNDVIYSLITNNLNLNIDRFTNFINKDFYIKKINKKNIQMLLFNNNINTPKILNKIKNYPIYLKENQHEGLVKKINNEIELFDYTSNLKDYYIEEYIEPQNEIKCYYIFGNVYDKTTQIFDNKIVSLLNKVSKTLALDIMSVDILVKNNTYYVIDVNQSPGFYLSDIARLNLIKKIKEM